ncbi:MAG: hypothetical protein BWY63_03660 [Chloroflexi bacterium ADurb.Bin360]|nr:MAG: hypothetical protein BWY63_03660 [Chloroflexi bacterium ADurb.Bin360]
MRGKILIERIHQGPITGLHAASHRPFVALHHLTPAKTPFTGEVQLLGQGKAPHLQFHRHSCRADGDRAMIESRRGIARHVNREPQRLIATRREGDRRAWRNRHQRVRPLPQSSPGIAQLRERDIIHPVQRHSGSGDDSAITVKIRDRHRQGLRSRGAHHQLKGFGFAPRRLDAQGCAHRRRRLRAENLFGGRRAPECQSACIRTRNAVIIAACLRAARRTRQRRCTQRR